MNNKYDNLKFTASVLALVSLLLGALLLTFVPRGTANQVADVSSGLVGNDSDEQKRAAKASITAASERPKTEHRTESLRKVYSQSAASENQHFEPWASQEVEQFEQLLRQELDSDKPSPTASQWLDLGWVVYRNVSQGTVFIAEHKSRRVGRGLYAIRTTTAKAIMLQAPHRFFDQMTGVIARKLFDEHTVRAAAWNTMHRSKFDVAHQDNSFFNVFTKVTTEVYPDLMNVQLHGFDNSDVRATISQPEKPLAIVSNATGFPSGATKRLARELKSLWGSNRVWLFPHETRELGATTNAQGSLMRKSGNKNFFHVELAREIRDQLTKSKKKRTELFRVFSSSLLLQ